MFSEYSEITVAPEFFLDEVFSSWFRRLANAHGVNARELHSFLVPGSQLASYDLDRHACDVLIDGLANKVSMDVDCLSSATLKRWEGIVSGEVNAREKMWWLAPAGKTLERDHLGNRYVLNVLRLTKPRTIETIGD